MMLVQRIRYIKRKTHTNVSRETSPVAFSYAKSLKKIEKRTNVSRETFAPERGFGKVPPEGSLWIAM